MPLAVAEIPGAVEGVGWASCSPRPRAQLAPILLFVVAVQRYAIAGLTASAVKG